MPSLLHEASDEAGLFGDRVVALLNASRVAKAFEVDGDDAMVLGQLRDEVVEAICVTEKAVDEDRGVSGRCRARCSAWGRRRHR